MCRRNSAAVERLSKDWLFPGGLREYQVFGSNDLPDVFSFYPGIGPDVGAFLHWAFLQFPGFTSLRDGGVSKKTNFHFVDVIRNHIACLIFGVGKFFSFVIASAIGVDAQKVVGENAFEGAGVSLDAGLGPLRFTLLDVVFDLGLIEVFLCGDGCERQK
jgi:hypothetical protein